MNFDFNASKRSKIWFHNMHPIFDELNTLNIHYALIKGEALSWYMYGFVGKRISNDIDILTDRTQLTTIDSILRKNGFEQYGGDNQKATRSDIISSLVNSHQTIAYKKMIEPYKIRIEVDLNFSILWGENRENELSTKEILDNYIYLDIYGEQVKVLWAPYAFIQVILHHYKDCNSLYLLYTRNSINHQQFREIYLFWRKYKHCITTQWLYMYTRKVGIIEYVYYMLYYTNYIYNDKALGRYVETLRTEQGEQLLDKYGLSEKERRKWNNTFEERLLSDSLSCFIENELTEHDKNKINYSKRLF